MNGQTIAIIPCTNQKSNVAGPAREVWRGSHFQLTLAHAERFYDKVLVMSYKYGFISPDQEIEPYDIDIRVSSAKEKLEWWWKVKEGMMEMAKEQPALVALYTGYDTQRIIREFVRSGILNVILPWNGARVGERMQHVYDNVPPFDHALIEKGVYTLKPEEVLPKRRGRPKRSKVDDLEMEFEEETD